MTKTKQSGTAKRSYKRTNEILEDHGDWLLVDISTSKHPDATMAVDTDAFNSHKGGRICAVTMGLSKYIYAQYKVSGERTVNKFHRDIIDTTNGKEVDHINHGDMSFIDNRRSNLRAVTHAENIRNRGTMINNKAGASGVTWSSEREKWRARIILSGKELHLGYFDNIEIAIGARQQAERELFGEFAYGGSK